MAVPALLFATFAIPSFAAGEGDKPPVADKPEFRTEADDKADANETDQSNELGRFGAIKFPVSAPQDCQATIALYTPRGQLVRILGQVLDLRKGEYVARWDGMDLFGNLVPVGTDLVAKTITNPGVKAFYEFTVAGNCEPPWVWFADHSPPGSAVAIGDKVVFGSALAEHGDNIICLDLTGRKLWGSKLAGWAGPRYLTTDGKYLYIVHRLGGEVHRWDIEDLKAPRPKGGIIQTGPDRIRAIAASKEAIFLACENGQGGGTRFNAAFGGASIDYKESRPQALSAVSPGEGAVSPQAAFANTFHTDAPGNPQNGCTMVRKNLDAHVVLVFKQPVEIGTIVLGQMPLVERMEVLALKEGVAYNALKHSPVESAKAGGDDTLSILELTHLDANWVPIGTTTTAGLINVLPTARPGMKTRAIHLKAKRPDKLGNDKTWQPGLAMARMMARRFEAVPGEPKLTVAGEIDKQTPVEGKRLGWNLRTKVPISDVLPVSVVADYGSPRTFDGLVMLNVVNPTVAIDVYVGDGQKSPPLGGDDAWQQVAVFKGRYDKKQRFLTASKKANDHYIDLPQRMTSRALRFRVLEGYRAGKWGQFADDPFRTECDEVALLKFAQEPKRPPANLFRAYAPAGGKPAYELAGDADLDIRAMACAPGGALFTVVGDKLCRTEPTAGGLKHAVLNEKEIKTAISMTATADRIAVGDEGRHAVLLFDHAGKLLSAVGERGARKPGPWDPYVLDRPSGVALDARGCLWVAEERFNPKRISRFGPDGKFMAEFIGPPMYGGGGFLDPDLKSFYYRGMHFDLDWDKGASRLRALNDTLTNPGSPAQEAGSFQYTGIGRPMYYKGKRYILGNGTVCMLDGDVWKPCVVMGEADGGTFLMGATREWRKHWARFDLTGKSFIWCDQNDDGKYQAEEVELFDRAGKHMVGGAWGPDFTIYGAYVLRPARFTAGGVPIYRSADFKPFQYDAPHYSRNYTLGGPHSAKPGYSGFKLVTRDGCVIQEGQPYVIQPDGGILGGPVTARPSDYSPPISGVVLNQPWSFPGSVVSKSPVGELAAVNSNNGYWYVWAAKYGVIVSTFFNGKTGGFGWGMESTRGFDVTGRKHAWETWDSHFLRADNGNCYTVAGKGFHGLCRIEGLDSFQVQETPVKVSAENFALNTALRPMLKSTHDAAAAAGSKTGRKDYTVLPLATRTSHFKLDGELEDWGKRTNMQPLGPEGRKLFFDLAHDEKGLYLAFVGAARLANGAKSEKDLFRGGFALEMCMRRDNRARSADVIAGDKRLVFAPLGGKWTAVMYDYIDPNAAKKSAVVYESPIAPTTVARVAALTAEQCTLAVKINLLGSNLTELGGGGTGGGDLDSWGDGPTLPGATKKPKPAVAKDQVNWSAEVFIPWATLGIAYPPGMAIRCDFALGEPDASGTKTAARVCWSNRSPIVSDDAGIEAMLLPGSWGYITLK